MSYIDQLRDINSRINTTNIKGKEYAEVNQRILAFWELFPDGNIVTEVATTDARCDCRCEVYRHAEDERPAATGHAFEEKKGAINSTSYVENCETSAIGRALGILGIGATQAIASKEELENALAQQAAGRKPNPQPKGEGCDWTRLTALNERYAAATGMSVDEAKKSIVHTYGITRDMPAAKFAAVCAAIETNIRSLEGNNG